MEWLAHPIVVATYVALLGLAITAVSRLTGLFHRMTRVEEGVRRLEKSVTDLSTDLRAHMAEEGKNIAHLEALIVKRFDQE